MNNEVELKDLPEILQNKSFKIRINNKDVEVKHALSQRQIELLVEGGLINWVKKDLKNKGK